MKTLRLAGWLSLMMLALAACGTTGNISGDAQSAQRLLPNLAGFTVTDVDTSIDGAFAAAGGAALVSGQVAITAAIAKVEQVLQCFQDRGAIAARFYNEANPDSIVPLVGAVLVINQSRVNQELINCILGGQEAPASAQTIAIEPCASAGTFNYQGDTVSFVYVGSHSSVCALYEQHFNNLAGTAEATARPTTEATLLP